MLERNHQADQLPKHVRDLVEDEARNAMLRALHTPADKDGDLQNAVKLAASLLNAPMALVALVDESEQRFIARHGLEATGSPISHSFCAHSIAARDDGPMVVRDASLDPRFAANPLVTGAPFIRFYAGMPLTVMGERIGSLCVLDTEPRPDLTPREREQLKRLGSMVASLFSLKDSSGRGEIARAALVREEKRHTLALEAASIASWVWDLRTDTVECDHLLPQLFGLPVTNRLHASTFLRTMDPRDLRSASDKLRTALATGEDYSGIYRVRNTNPVRWVAGRGRVLDRDVDGKPILFFGVNFDVTDSKTSEERQRLLLREINHRVKNTLATVQALATQTVRHAREPREFLDAFGGRLQALGLAHGLLSDREWGGISLREVIRVQAMPFTDSREPRIRASGDDVLLSPDQALGLGLILHELASNALKHGALSVPEGVVDLTWWKVGTLQPRLMLAWQERGGPLVQRPSRAGFGSILIKRSLDKVLGSEVRHEFLPSGVETHITTPIEKP